MLLSLDKSNAIYNLQLTSYSTFKLINTQRTSHCSKVFQLGVPDTEYAFCVDCFKAFWISETLLQSLWVVMEVSLPVAIVAEAERLDFWQRASRQHAEELCGSRLCRPLLMRRSPLQVPICSPEYIRFSYCLWLSPDKQWRPCFLLWSKDLSRIEMSGLRGV